MQYAPQTTGHIRICCYQYIKDGISHGAFNLLLATARDMPCRSKELSSLVDILLAQTV